jgi:hypothetical protein
MATLCSHRSEFRARVVALHVVVVFRQHAAVNRIGDAAQAIILELVSPRSTESLKNEIPQHSQAQERSLAQTLSERVFPLHPDASLLAQPGGDLVLHPARKIPAWCNLHIGQAAQGAYLLFIESYNQNAKPFVWTKAKVHQRRVKGRRISEL